MSTALKVDAPTHPVRDDLWFGDEDPARSAEDAAQSFAASVARVVGLKPFPATAYQILGVLSSGNFRMSDVERELRRDPALTLAVLRVANSAAFAAGEPVHSIQRALVRLGARTVRGVIATAATMGLFEDVAEYGARVKQHCAGTAGIAHALARRVSFREPGTAFICGLMHDIGKLLALQCGEIDYVNTFPPEALASPGGVHLLERRAAGYDHAVLGGHVLDHWEMPSPVPEVVALHHQHGRAWNHPDRAVGVLVAIVDVANRLDHAMEATVDPAQAQTEVARSGGASYLDLVTVDLEAMWSDLVSAREAAAATLV